MVVIGTCRMQSSLSVELCGYSSDIAFHLIKQFERRGNVKLRNVPHRASARFLFSTYSYTRICCLSLIQQPRSFTRLRCRIPVIKTTSFKKSSAFPDLSIFFAAISVPSRNIPCKCSRQRFHYTNLPSTGVQFPLIQMSKSFN